jgi:hypothetical protein
VNRARGAASLSAACLLAGFIALATCNSGGYRFGASDQAFYEPAIRATLDSELFPRDRPLITSQAKLTLVDESVALAVRATGLPLPVVFLALYVASLVLLAAAAWSIGRKLYASTWTCIALLVALTLRHAIARSGTNTLEGYFHPRQLAFGLGALAIASFLRARTWPALLLVGAAGAVHPTTALWFAVWIGVATMVVERSSRLVLGLLALAALAGGAWSLTAGPLAGRLQPMDPEWLATLVSKDYLFPLAWPSYAWFFNLGTVVLLAGAYVLRRRSGFVDDRERALVAGCFSLMVLFVMALVLQSNNIALAIQLQPARTFWMFDFLATIYVIWAVGEAGDPGAKRAVPLLMVLLMFSAGRSVYVLAELDRRPFQVDIADDDWGRAMGWMRKTPKGSGVLADPMHAVEYGTSVRVAGERDVFVEGVKDAAIGMYDRAVAMRTAERLRALPNFAGLNPDAARDLGSRYGLDYMVTAAEIDLPLAFESGKLRIYQLR